MKGHDFSRAASPAKSTRALAPEGRFPPISPEISSFSAACLAAEGRQVDQNTFPRWLNPAFNFGYRAARLKPFPFKTEKKNGASSHVP
jgi:hypothetical protein